MRPARLQLDTSPLTQAIYSALCIAGAPTPGPAPPLQTELWSQTPGRARACARAVCALRRSAHALAAALAADKNLNQERAGLVRPAGARAGRNQWKPRQPSPPPPDGRPQPKRPTFSPPRRSGAAVRPQPPGRTPHDPASGCRRRAAPPPKVEHPGLRVPRRGRVPRRARRSWCRAVHSDSLLDGLCRRLGDLPAHGRALSPQRSAPGLPGRPAPWQQQHTKDLLNDFGCC